MRIRTDAYQIATKWMIINKRKYVATYVKYVYCTCILICIGSTWNKYTSVQVLLNGQLATFLLFWFVKWQPIDYPIKLACVFVPCMYFLYQCKCTYNKHTSVAVVFNYIIDHPFGHNLISVLVLTT